jgi:hypothetical protein
MTAIASIIKDNYSMIATDSRVMPKYPTENILFEDRCSKLFDSGFGWVAGIGYGVLANNFSNMLKQKILLNTGDVNILTTFDEAYKHTKATDNDDKIDTTIITYSFFDKNQDSKLQIGILNPKSDNRIVLKNKFISFLPNRTIEMNEIEQKYKKSIEDSNNM